MLTLKERECYILMANYILKYKKDDQPDLDKISIYFSVHKISIVDDSLLPKTVLVKLDDAQLGHLRDDLDHEWSILPEKKYKLPHTKKSIKG